MLNVLKYRSSTTKAFGIIFYSNNKDSFFLELRFGKNVWLIGF